MKVVDEAALRAAIEKERQEQLDALAQRFRDSELTFDQLLMEVYQAGYQHSLDIIEKIATDFFSPKDSNDNRHDEEGSGSLDHEGVEEERCGRD